MNTSMASVEIATELRAKNSVQALQGPVLDVVLDYIAALHHDSLTTCATATDDVVMRRAQGEVKAFKTVMELFEYTPVKQRRATSRHLV